VLRPGYLLSERTAVGGSSWNWLEAVPSQFGSCVVAEQELFRAVERLLEDPFLPKQRTFTLLGPNRPWCEVGRDRRGAASLRFAVRAARAFFRWFPAQHLLAGALSFLARRVPRLRAWNFTTLHPQSLRELLALYNPLNYQHVKIVGYNNGVTHFGHRYP